MPRPPQARLQAGRYVSQKIKKMESGVRLPAGPDGSVLLVQLTDLHLPEEAGALVAGVDTDHSLRKVLRSVADDLPRNPDFILATGDIADTGAASAYRRFRQSISAIEAPAFGLPGNHDLPAVLFDEWRGHVPEWIDTPAWRIILLDTTLPGEDGGRLGPQRLAGLHRALDGAPDHVLVVLHHHPVPVRSQWLDEYMLQDAAALFECIAKRDQVRALLCGHVHQEQDGWYRSTGVGAWAPEATIRVLASPSTAFQFMPRTREYQLDAAGPAYRWLLLHPDGGLDTGVEYLAAGSGSS